MRIIIIGGEAAIERLLKGWHRVAQEAGGYGFHGWTISQRRQLRSSAFGFCPEGAEHGSPGQRPGKPDDGRDLKP